MIIQSNRISKFQLSSLFENNSQFLKSEKYLSYYYSYKISGEDLYSAFKDEICSQDLDFTGNWNITGGCTNAIDNISLDDLSAAVTVNWCKNNLLDKLNELSSQLFNESNLNLKLPSYVGQVIVSHTLSSEAMVKKIYGGENWQQIKGRFLLGTGPNESNTNKTTYGSCSYGELNISSAKKTGGANSVPLKTKNVPGHSHTINGCIFGTLPSKEIDFKVGLETEAVFGYIDISIWHSSHQKHHGGFSGQGKTHDKGTYASNEMVTINELVGSGDISKSFSFTPRADSVSSNCGVTNETTSSHNNMPPYIGKFIWERIA